MTINVKLRSALALAIVALAATSLELRSANAEHVTPVRAGHVSTLANQAKKAGVKLIDERASQIVAERKTRRIAEGPSQIVAERKGRLIDERTSRVLEEKKGRVINNRTSLELDE